MSHNHKPHSRKTRERGVCPRPLVPVPLARENRPSSSERPGDDLPSVRGQVYSHDRSYAMCRMVHVILDLREKARSVLLLLLLSVTPTSGADRVRIEVRSSWMGFGGSHNATIITGDNSKYSANGHPVAKEAVQGLFSALDEPPVENPSLENCGIDAHWLNANLELAQRDFSPTPSTLLNRTPPSLAELDTSAQQISLFRSHFTDVAYVRQAFEHEFKEGRHFDDYPEMSVEVWRDGKKESAHSNSQHLFMLPWIVDGNATRATFNCHISRSIANLLPSKFTNRERLLPGLDFRRTITAEFEARRQHMWDTEETLGPDLAPIRARFTVVDSEVSCLPYFGESIDGDNCLTWNAKLTAQNLPGYMHLNVSLTYSNGRLNAVDQFLARIEDYVALVGSIPWLAEFMNRHPDQEVELRYSRERSLARKAALSDLGKELRDHQKNEIADRLTRESDKCALLQIGDPAGRSSTWVVFPNREMLLWQFDGDSALKWKKNQLDGWGCPVLTRCTGIVIQPNGTLAPP